MPPASLARTALVLGLLSAVGPFAIDMYLPALPAIAADLDASIAATQGTITAYFIAFGLAQMVYGPWADQAGRKPPLYAGMAILLVGTIGCALAGSMEQLIAWRAVQGLGASAAMVVPRAIIRDMYTGTQAARLMAAIMMVISVSPMLAPLSGAALIAIGDWRLIFWVLSLACLVSAGLLATVQPETLPPADRVRVRARTIWSGIRTLMRDPVFLGLTFIGGFGMASFFVFIASASFVYTGQFGLSPTGFSLAFALNAAGFIGASQAAAPLGERIGMHRVVALGVAGFALFAVGLFALSLAGLASLPVVMVGLLLANACLGVVIPSTMVMALDHHGDIAGMASSLGGTLQMLAGGLMIAAAGPFFDGTVVPMLGAIAVCAVVALVLSRLVPLQAAGTVAG